nr:galactoside-binding soluble lectin 13 isoform X3 [Pongo abelii]
MPLMKPFLHSAESTRKNGMSQLVKAPSGCILQGARCGARPPLAPSRRVINDPQLQVDFHTETNEESDIAFHFRVYFGHCVIMNSRECGAWKCEVRCNNVPFEDGKSFDVRISVLANEYQVTVNGQQCYSFAHRLPPCSVKMVQVCRDISLTSVCVCN